MMDESHCLSDEIKKVIAGSFENGLIELEIELDR